MGDGRVKRRQGGWEGSREERGGGWEMNDDIIQKKKRDAMIP